MRHILILLLALQIGLFSKELKITSDTFSADENRGVSIFKGSVNILQDKDELNASEVSIYTNKNNKPTKFIALGNVSFTIETKQGAKYTGAANRVIYFPVKKEYHFFQNVHLKQLDEKKEISGDEVVLQTLDGKAYAKGMVKKPVIMIFDIDDEQDEEK